jgi:superfamily I DNA and/or RNA helicase
MTIINEFIEALNQEIDTLKKGKGGNTVTVYNGELIRKTLDLSIYQFTLENFLIILDDTPANIEINGNDYECDIISVNGQQIQVSIKYNLNDRISVAKIKTNTWYLLERLKKKYEENLTNLTRFQNSNELFKGTNSKIDGGKFDPSYSINFEFPPNPSQHKAVESSINDFVSIIWGPPGTGKTATIALAIESHLNLGRKVLLLSHSNNAVDQALTKVASQMKSSYYNLGQLVRYGLPKADALAIIDKEYPLVLIDKIAEFKSKELINEKNELEFKIEALRNNKNSFEKVIELNNQFNEWNSKLLDNRSKIKSYESKLENLIFETSKLNLNKIELVEKLDRASKSGLIKRLYLGLNPKKIEENINKINKNIDFNFNQQTIIKEQVKQLQQSKKPIELERSKKESELSKLLNQLQKSLKDIQLELKDYDKKLKQIQTRLDEINIAINEIKLQVLKDSKLIATTLTKSYISKELENLEFDILIVDEVSMAPLPILYWAASKVKKGITIVGDFKQLPPICTSDETQAKKWLGRSIFDMLDINEISKAEKRVQLLNLQYRMHPDISAISNKYIYDNRLEDFSKTINKTITDKISGKSSICLIDTTEHNPWCSQFETGGRFNLINAIICINLAEKISVSLSKEETIGIITPYRNQARLILKIAEDKGLLNKVKIRINTVHSFQGGEETAIIFDSVEGQGAKKWSMINESNNIESAKLLINVALTRAEKKLYIIANESYFTNTFSSNLLFMKVLNHYKEKGKVVKSSKVISNLKDENFDQWISKLNSLKNRPINSGSSFNDDEFWPSFHNDLANSINEVIIFSPFLTIERFSKLHLIFTELLSKGIKIYIITLPPNEQPAIMQGSKEVMKKLNELGVSLKFRKGMHEKIALIDKKIKWIGSLNILSHNSRKEYMERVEGENSSKELFEKFNLEKLLSPSNRNGEICPNCKDNFLIEKNNTLNRNSFYGCCGYPACNHTAQIAINTKSAQQNTISATLKTTTAPEKNANQWESKTLIWSSTQLPGFSYSEKKKAWWKKK